MNHPATRNSRLLPSSQHRARSLLPLGPGDKILRPDIGQDRRGGGKVLGPGTDTVELAEGVGVSSPFLKGPGGTQWSLKWESNGSDM